MGVYKNQGQILPSVALPPHPDKRIRTPIEAILIPATASDARA
jgi:hypothetical protein